MWYLVNVLPPESFSLSFLNLIKLITMVMFSNWLDRSAAYLVQLCIITGNLFLLIYIVIAFNFNSQVIGFCFTTIGDSCTHLKSVGSESTCHIRLCCSCDDEHCKSFPFTLCNYTLLLSQVLFACYRLEYWSRDAFSSQRHYVQGLILV